MTQCELEARRQAFIDDIVGVCKKHRVMLYLDDMCDHESVQFVESAEDDQYSFVVEASDIEEAVRSAVWGLLNKSDPPFQPGDTVVCRRDSWELDASGQEMWSVMRRKGCEYEVEQCVWLRGCGWTVSIEGELHLANDFKPKEDDK